MTSQFHICFFMLMLVLSGAQQEYEANSQLNCYNNFTSTSGYTCNYNSTPTSCPAYLTFRSSLPYYDSAATIGYLLGTSPSLIVGQHNLSSDVVKITQNTLLTVPINCSCTTFSSLDYFQHVSSYSVKSSPETYFLIANDTYQGLTTCQALMAQNPDHNSRALLANDKINVPLRCACPSKNQSDSGVNFLLTYLVTWGDYVSSISQSFGVPTQSVLDANNLSLTSSIFPFTTLLIPLQTPPRSNYNSAPSPPPTLLPSPPPDGSKGKIRKWVVGVGVGVGLSTLAALFILLICIARLRKKNTRDESTQKMAETTSGTKIPVSESSDYELSKSSWAISPQGVRYAIGSLTLYEFEELSLATSSFSELNKIGRSSVYVGTFKGDRAAVKVMKGDVSGEINILKQINHSNVVRLSGFCLHEGDTYLVYEYVEFGSLYDWLHGKERLTWKQRVQVAYGVADALNYLHNYTDPACIHKNLTSSNVLVDSNMRAKVCNFGMARRLDEIENGDEDGRIGLHVTRHVIGTHGYMAPEYVENGLVTPKLDVFAFGVVLLEIVSGREAVSAKKLSLWETIGDVVLGENVREKLRGFVDSSLGEVYPFDLSFSMAQLGLECVAKDFNLRPMMSHVFMVMSKLLSSSLDWDPSAELGHSQSFSHAS